MDIIIDQVRTTAFSRFISECEETLGGKIQQTEEWDFAFQEGMSPTEAVQLYWKTSLERAPQPMVHERI